MTDPIEPLFWVGVWAIGAVAISVIIALVMPKPWRPFFRPMHMIMMEQAREAAERAGENLAKTAAEMQGRQDGMIAFVDDELATGPHSDAYLAGWHHTRKRTLHTNGQKGTRH